MSNAHSCSLTCNGWYRRHRVDLMLAVVVGLLIVPIVQPLMTQQQPRYALTAAIHDHQTIRLDRYADQIGADHARRDGTLYADKAPGQPVLAVPAYAAYRAFGGVPAEDDGQLGNLGLWAVSLWTAALPTIGTVLLLRRLALRVAPERATAAALGVLAGTMLLPFGTQLFSHALTAFLCLASYLLIWRGRAPALLAAGLLAGAAVASEYSVALVAGVLTVAAAARHRRRALWFVAGAVPVGAALALYHWVAFGGPLQFPYLYANLPGHQEGLVGAQVPRLAMLAQVLVGERGLFVITPIVLVAVVGCVLLLREHGEGRFHAVVAMVALGLLVALQAGWGNPTGGWSPGARYVVPSLPFLVVGAAWVWQRWPWAAAAAALVGAAVMLLGTLTLPLAPNHGPAAIPWWLERVWEGRTAKTLLTMRLGDWALLVPPALAGVVAWRLLLTGGLTTGRRER